jgi:tetratricopeptide (TPR) repeat protein
MKKLTIVAFSIMFMILGGMLFAQPWDADLYFQRAEQYHAQNDFLKALDMYNSILIKEPENVRALNGRGVIYQRQGDYLKAKADFQYALKLNPSLGETIHNLESVNERIKANTNSPLSSAAPEEYKDAAKILGTNEFSVGGQQAKPVQKQAQNQSYSAAPPPITYGAPSGYASNSPYGGEITSLYDRTIQQEANKSSLYDRTIQQEANRASLYDRTIQQAPGASGYGSTGTLPYGTTEQNYPGSSRLGATQYAPPQTQYLYPPAQPGGNARIQSERLPQSVQPVIPVSPAVQGLPQSSLRSMRIDSQVQVMPPSYQMPDLNAASYYERAVLAYTDVIARNPNFAIAFNNRGVAYARLGDYTKALEDFNQALRLNPFYYDAQANREQVKFSLAIK